MLRVKMNFPLIGMVFTIESPWSAETAVIHRTRALNHHDTSDFTRCNSRAGGDLCLLAEGHVDFSVAVAAGCNARRDFRTNVQSITAEARCSGVVGCWPYNRICSDTSCSSRPSRCSGRETLLHGQSPNGIRLDPTVLSGLIESVNEATGLSLTADDINTELRKVAEDIFGPIATRAPVVLAKLVIGVIVMTVALFYFLADGARMFDVTRLILDQRYHGNF